jgi:hypothetical protein
VELLNEHVTEEIGDHILKDESRACIRVFKECVQQLRTIVGDNEPALKALIGALNTAHTLGMVRQDLPALYRGMTRTRPAAKARAKKSEEGYGPLDGLVLSLTISPTAVLPTYFVKRLPSTTSRANRRSHARKTARCAGVLRS